MGFPGTGNTGPKTAGNREHRPQNSREQGTFIKNSGTREHAARTTEHWLENGREHGTMALKAPGTGNIDLKTAGTREHRTPLFFEVISADRKYYPSLFFRSRKYSAKIFSREQGTLTQKQPGTGNIGLKTAGNREHSLKSNVGISNPSM